VRRYAGTGDAARTIRLLWRGEDERPSGRPGPKARLDLGTIVGAAITVADEGAGATVSMRAVADRLGCTPMALYTHVGGKGELLDLMYDRVHAELNGLSRRGTWEEQVTRWTMQVVELYVRHPWIDDVSVIRPVLGPGEQTALESLLAAMEPADLPPTDRATISSTLFSLGRSTARTITEAREAEVETGHVDSDWWAARARALGEVAPDFAERFPLSVRLGSAGARRPAARRRPSEVPIMERAARRVLRRTVELLLSGASAEDDHGETSRLKSS
jgi:AcrR family transcriptional regulator